jgi:hypothetical protein
MTRAKVYLRAFRESSDTFFLICDKSNFALYRTRHAALHFHHNCELSASGKTPIFRRNADFSVDVPLRGPLIDSCSVRHKKMHPRHWVFGACMGRPRIQRRSNVPGTFRFTVLDCARFRLLRSCPLELREHLAGRRLHDASFLDSAEELAAQRLARGAEELDPAGRFLRNDSAGWTSVPRLARLARLRRDHASGMQSARDGRQRSGFDLR